MGQSFSSLLRASGILSAQQLAFVEAEHARTGAPLAQVILDHGLTDESPLYDALARAAQRPRTNLQEVRVERSAAQRVDAQWALDHQIAPLWHDAARGVLTVAVADPTQEDALAALAARAGCQVEVELATASEVGALLRHQMFHEPLDRDPSRVNRSFEDEGAEDASALVESVASSPSWDVPRTASTSDTALEDLGLEGLVIDRPTAPEPPPPPLPRTTSAKRAPLALPEWEPDAGLVSGGPGLEGLVLADDAPPEAEASAPPEAEAPAPPPPKAPAPPPPKAPAPPPPKAPAPPPTKAPAPPPTKAPAPPPTKAPAPPPTEASAPPPTKAPAPPPTEASAPPPTNARRPVPSPSSPFDRISAPRAPPAADAPSGRAEAGVSGHASSTPSQGLAPIRSTPPNAPISSPAATPLSPEAFSDRPLSSDLYDEPPAALARAPSQPGQAPRPPGHVSPRFGTTPAPRVASAPPAARPTAPPPPATPGGAFSGAVPPPDRPDRPPHLTPPVPPLSPPRAPAGGFDLGAGASAGRTSSFVGGAARPPAPLVTGRPEEPPRGPSVVTGRPEPRPMAHAPSVLPGPPGPHDEQEALRRLQPVFEATQEMARELKAVFELCVARGIITREEYLARLQRL